MNPPGQDAARAAKAFAHARAAGYLDARRVPA